MITILPATGSTNADLLARPEAREGDWLVARRQLAGRGRAGRTWHDGAGNFMGSTLALLDAGDPPAPTLALVAGLATFEAVAASIAAAPPDFVRAEPVAARAFASPPEAGKSTPDPTATCGRRSGQASASSGSSEAPPGLFLKWPNDLLVGTAKLAGILLERQGQRVVVGIGVNLVHAPRIEGRAVTSLAEHGRVPPLNAFADTLAARFAALLARWHGGDWPNLRAEWLARAHPAGTPLAVGDLGERQTVGSFLGLQDDGAALLRLADGSTRVIHAGDVELVGERIKGGDAAGG